MADAVLDRCAPVFELHRGVDVVGLPGAVSEAAVVEDERGDARPGERAANGPSRSRRVPVRLWAITINGDGPSGSACWARYSHAAQSSLPDVKLTPSRRPMSVERRHSGEREISVSRATRPVRRSEPAHACGASGVLRRSQRCARLPATSSRRRTRNARPVNRSAPHGHDCCRHDARRRNGTTTAPRGRARSSRNAIASDSRR
jgi:hypothetical protein